MTGSDDAGAENQAGLGVETANLRDHLGEILLIDSADLAQAGKVALGQQIEMIEQLVHGGIEAPLFLDLQPEALRQIARANAGR